MAQRRKNGLKEDSRSKGEGRRKLRSESLEERILLSATWVDTDTDAADDAGGEGAPDPGGADAAAELDAAMSGTDDLFGDGEPGADGGGATVLEGGEGEDSFVIAGAGDGEVFQVRGGGGADRVDLSSYDSSSASFEDGAVVMETGDGGSFRVEYEGVEGFAFGDADAHVLSGDASGEVAGGTAILVDGSSTATVGVEGAGQALWSYDASTGGVSIDGVSGTDGGTTLRLDAASDSPLAIRSVGVGGDLGAVESAGDVGELTIASDADVREITVGGGEGEIGVVSYTGGKVWTEPVTINADVGELRAYEFGTDVTVNGDVERVSVEDDLTNGGTLRVAGDVGELSVGDDIWKGAGVSVGGDVERLTVGGAIEGGSEVSVGGDLAALTASRVEGSIVVGGDAGLIGIAGDGIDSDLRGDLRVGGDLGTLDVGDDIEGSVTVAGNAGSIVAGDDLKGDGRVSVAGDLGSIAAGDDGEQDISVGGDLGSLSFGGDYRGTLTVGKASGGFSIEDGDFSFGETLRGQSVVYDGVTNTIELGEPTAEAPELSVSDVSGAEDGAIALGIDASAVGEGDELRDVLISGVPDGAVLSADEPVNRFGSVEMKTDGPVTVTFQGEEAGYRNSFGYYTINPDGSIADAELPWTNASQRGSGGDFVVGETSFDIDAQEGQRIGFFLIANGDRANDFDVLGEGTLEFRDPSGGPATVEGGSPELWHVSPDGSETKVRGNIWHSAAEGERVGLNSDGINHARTSVDASANAINLSFEDLKGGGDRDYDDIVFSIGMDQASLPDAGDWDIEEVGDGVYRVGVDAVDSLKITPPADFSGSFDLDVTAIAADGDATASATETVTIEVRGVADAPELDLADAGGAEDTAIALDLSAAVSDASENLTVTVSGVPDGASLSAGVDNGDGTWTLSPDELNGLEVTPPEDFSGEIRLGVTAESREPVSGDTAVASGELVVGVRGMADAPELSVGGPDEVSVTVSGDHYKGEPKFRVFVDGERVGGTYRVDADAAAREWQTFNFRGDFGADGPGRVEVQFVNDKWGGSADTDRNLIVDSISVNGKTYEAEGEGVTYDRAGKPDIEGREKMAWRGSLEFDTSDAPGSVALTAGEDTPIELPIDFALTDASETGAIVVSGLPDGATLSAGVDNGDGSYRLTPGELGGLTIATPEHYTGSFDLQVTATSSDGADSASVSDSVRVHVTPVADGVALSAADSSGAEDSAIALDISATVIDASETASLTVSGVPEGASLSAGVSNGDGSYTLTPGELEGLSVTPPTDFTGSFELSVEAATADGDSVATASDSVRVTVSEVADAPDLVVSDARGSEDSAIPLRINASFKDAGAETSVTVSGVPAGATLSAGVDNGDGSYTLRPDQLEGLTLLPPDDFSGSFDLQVEATSAVSGEAPPIDFNAADLDTFNRGQDRDPGVEIVDGGNTLVLSGNAWKGIPLDQPITEDTVLEFEFRSDAEGEAHAIGFANGSRVVQDNSFKVFGTQDWGYGTVHGAGGNDPYDGSGEWQKFSIRVGDYFTGDFDTMTFVTDNDVRDSQAESLFRNVRLFEAGEAQASSASESATLRVTVDAVADAPELTVSDASGVEDTAVPLDIGAAVSDDSETLAVTISGVPEGATLSAGVDNGDGTYTLEPAELEGLKITPPENFSGRFTLGVTAVSADGDDSASVSDTVAVSIAGVADEPDLVVADTRGAEDTAIPLDIAASVSDAGESASVTVSGVPAGASLSGGVDNGDGSWTLAVGELDGLTLTPPENFAGEIDLRVEATSVESGEVSPVDFNAHELSDYGRTQDRDPFAEVSGDGGTLHLAQNTWKDIVFDYEVTPDTVLEFEFRAEGEPEIAGIGFDNDERQSAGRTFCVHGTQGWGVDAGERYDGSGEWQKFSIRVGDHFTGDMDRLTFIHDQDARGDSGDSFFRHVRVFEDGATPVETSASVSADVRVVVDAVADAPELAAADAAGVEDGSIPLSIDAVATDASETVSLNIAGLPEGASLSAGTPNPDGSYTVRAEELGGLSVRPPADFSGSFDLRVTATAIEANGSAAETAQTITVDVAPVADGVAIEAPDASGSEDLSVPLRIGVEPMDADGSERVSLVRIGGLPDGASLSAGVDNGDGSYTLTPDELEGLAITPPLNFSGEMELSVEARSSDGADAAVSEAGLTVSVSGEADAPRLVTAPASGTAGEPMPLDIAVSITDADGSERIEEVRIAGVPGGASLSAGNDTGGGVWTLGPGELRGLELTTPGGFAGELTLEVTAVSVEGDTSASTTAPLAVSVDAVPSVGGAGASGAGEPFEAGDDASDAPDAIDWTETLEEGFGSEPNDAVAAMERLDERLAELAEADRAVAPGGLGLVEEIADEPLATSTPDLVPPTGDPVFEIEDSEPVARPDAAGASGGHPGEAGTPDARRPGDTDNEPDAAADSGEGSIARGEAGIFASLWGLVRSLGVRSDDIERSEMKKRSGS